METWSDKGDIALRWTAATALGYDLGLRDQENTLRQLRRLGCWEDGELASTASWAVARIFVRGSTKLVIKALADWLDDDRSDVRLLGLVAVLRIADMKVNELEDQFELTDTSAAAAGRDCQAAAAGLSWWLWATRTRLCWMISPIWCGS